MAKCKITVLKRALNTELAEEYSGVEVTKCPFFEEGQVFTCNLFEKPQNFCDWAWNDLYKVVSTLSMGGNYSTGIFDKWMKDDNVMIVCCSDGMRPVSFKVERIED